LVLAHKLESLLTFDSTVKWGATGFSVYNHMYIPRDFGSPEQNFWNLIEKAILCDVAVERQG
jgi:aminomethyltransferase